ncbi:MAG TPA: hypothetical protein VLV47_01170 [Candidatus Bathyarchaeia archaeon]|nr:hypothetical protein [Candidatus Bathyarchaeia archaeon]
MTTRHLKTYTGQTGYVYQYYFVGKRAALEGDPEAPSTEYVFDVTSDRKTTFAVSVFLQPRALEEWAATRGRSLSEPEQYAAVKLRLMQAFDEIPNMLHEGRRLRLDTEMLLALLESIGVD